MTDFQGVDVPNLNAFTLPERFWAKTREHDGGCLIWTAAIQSSGYGCFVHDGRTQSAHRLAYMEAKGPIPDGLQIDHLCRVRACVNPEHLEAVTAAENNRRKVGKSRPLDTVRHVYVDKWGRHMDSTHTVRADVMLRCSICGPKRRARA